MSRGRRPSVLRAAGDTALLPAAYVGGCVLALGVLAGAPATLTALSSALLIGWAVYTVDRVKLRDALLDPSDDAAHPERQRFVRRRSALLRMWLLAAAVGGTVLAFASSWAAALVAALSVPAVAAYAPGPRRGRARPKDLLAIKNTAVGVGIALFAAALVLGNDAFMPWVWEARAADRFLLVASLAALIAADAAACDFDDAAADLAFGTRSLPVGLGPRATAWLVGATGCGAGIVGAAACGWSTSSVAFFGCCAAGSCAALALRGRMGGPIRDAIELRLVVAAVACAAVGLLSGDSGQ